MSQAKRSKVLARERWRDQVARFIADLMHATVDWSPLICPFTALPHARRMRVDAYLTGVLGGHVLFDVHAVRGAALGLIALEDEQAVFEDWCRLRGLGPENRKPGAFTECGCCTGGWPGKLAREWPGDNRAPMGRSLARLGRRVLGAIEGQPSACGRCSFEHNGESDFSGITTSIHGWFVCPDCKGTGHNLRGTLPPLEWSPAARRKGFEARRGAVREKVSLTFKGQTKVIAKEAGAVQDYLRNLVRSDGAVDL
jgi:hypothetical protein